MPTEIIVLAAGQGKRMCSSQSKVLHTIAGKPMLLHLIETVSQLTPRCIHVVVGHQKNQVIRTIGDLCAHRQDIPLNWVEQSQQLGTGHAVLQALPSIQPDSTLLILNGDTPLITTNTLCKLVQSDKGLSLLTANLENPSDMGRIIRDERNQIVGVVEEKDATEQQRGIRETNTNCMAGKPHQFTHWLRHVQNQNAQQEFYLPDIIALAARDQIQIRSIQPDCPEEVLGVNTKIDLSRLERAYQRRLTHRLMSQGVTFRDPDRIDIRGECQFGQDCVIDINVVFEGTVRLGDHCVVGPNTVIKNSAIGSHCVVESHCVIEGSAVGDYCHIGPFARIRPNTQLADSVRIGNFVETKQSRIGARSKVNHLSYVGDSLVGQNVNIGAGVITCNYDGANKHQTVIGQDAFIGSDSQLIAPVEIGKGATIGAGSTITKNVAAYTLALSRTTQKSIDHWKRRIKK